MSDDPRLASPGSRRQPPAWRGWALLLATMGVTFLLGLLAASIVVRREEARPVPPAVAIDPWESDSSKWAINYPRQYDRYRMMGTDPAAPASPSAGVPTKYGHFGGQGRDYLAESPASVILFAGYAFAKEYRQAREHVHAVADITETKRRTDKTPATCWTCKSPDVPRMLVKLFLEGQPAAKEGVDPTAAGLDPSKLDSSRLDPAKFYKMSWNDLAGEITHPIGCLDCHEPGTMRLRITRPALRQAFAAQNKDIDKVSHQEMRSLVCAQCHVDYYFKHEGNYLTFPWAQGTQVEQIESYFEKSDPEFSDWTNVISNAPMLKMRHPDYEVYQSGIHAYRGVSCADCHMPYRTEGGVKFTDHCVRSPLANIANSCAVCHRWSEDEIRGRVEAIQDKVAEGRRRAEAALSLAHFDIAAAAQAGAKDDELKGVRTLVRRSQMRWDYVAANNGMGFHSPQECLRVLNGSLDLAGQCRVDCARILAKYGIADPVAYPDFSTKAKAQAIDDAFRQGKPPQLIVRPAAR
jgi:nitrite reductase (cytochrome c-552)